MRILLLIVFLALARAQDYGHVRCYIILNAFENDPSNGVCEPYRILEKNLAYFVNIILKIHEKYDHEYALLKQLRYTPYHSLVLKRGKMLQRPLDVYSRDAMYEFYGFAIVHYPEATLYAPGVLTYFAL